MIVAGHRWVEEYHVDGFRFDLASALCRDPLGQPLDAPPLIRAIAKDPVLSKVYQGFAVAVQAYSGSVCWLAGSGLYLM